jgi:hypothetical protein
MTAISERDYTLVQFESDVEANGTAGYRASRWIGIAITAPLST